MQREFEASKVKLNVEALKLKRGCKNSTLAFRPQPQRVFIDLFLGAAQGTRASALRSVGSKTLSSLKNRAMYRPCIRMLCRIEYARVLYF